jgi:hypothetical protein
VVHSTHTHAAHIGIPESGSHAGLHTGVPITQLPLVHVHPLLQIVPLSRVPSQLSSTPLQISVAPG